ncbi:DeoR/GlpR family DNA-binding transcription regulator [Azospirillum picis]|uniref:DeoR/GlpR family transcriptional regulator of sugar metabolism n=1 Tax=Azospirillum picis TaxID=488438 RepID=A0ABU0MPB9_9PROT|nr:DeoR/GlpR family DNA-binding transcription regulator [Azospirillum picis]MBP2301772.1 DeoR/GlpR family transcriptional regulator of sugar metabolism [Azospirillum picis]MDQ0535053.1 DeoR/GlpR family transcriptional regulator of sugar metabolism [Azospirillum picis]
MLQEERHQRIRALLASMQRATTERVASDLGVSRETVRRDFVELEARGELRRVHGGVVAVAPEPEPPIAVRSQVRLKEKRAIAKAAARLVTAGQTLFLDFGSTVSALAEELASLPGLTIVTNSFDVAQTIAQGKRGTATLLGGRVDEGIPATFGEGTVAEIHRYRADVALLSPAALDPRYGATSFDPREAEVARAMVDNADRVVILADHSKIGHTSRISFCPPGRIDTIVTDARSQEAAAFPALASAVPCVVFG